MDNWKKILMILGISALAFIIEAGGAFLILVLLFYFEFIYKEKK